MWSSCIVCVCLSLVDLATFQTLYNCGLALLRQQKPHQAFRCLYGTLEMYRNRPRLWLRMAEACIMCCNHEASAALEKVLTMHTHAHTPDFGTFVTLSRACSFTLSLSTHPQTSMFICLSFSRKHPACPTSLRRASLKRQWALAGCIVSCCSLNQSATALRTAARPMLPLFQALLPVQSPQD